MFFYLIISLYTIGIPTIENSIFTKNEVISTQIKDDFTLISDNKKDPQIEIPEEKSQGQIQIIGMPSITEQQQSIKKIISFHNNIDNKSKKYKHWGTHTPTYFYIAINGQEISAEETKNIEVQNDQFDIELYYEFMNGYRDGAYKITYKIENEAKELHMTFSWKDDWKVLFNNATPLEKEKINFIKK